MTSPDVIVIGGGIAGLRAAVDLSARGARVRVLEAKAVLGGRASSFVDPQTGDRVDNGQHVLVGCYHETFRFLATIGTADRVRLQPNLDVAFVDRHGARSRLRCPSLPAPMNLLAGLLEWEALGWSDRVAAMRMAKIPPASPFETVEQWLVHNGQTARMREMLWEPLALAALNQSVREAAAPPFARVLSDMFSGEPRDAALGLPLVLSTNCSPSRPGISWRHAAVMSASARRRRSCSDPVRCRGRSKWTCAVSACRPVP